MRTYVIDNGLTYSSRALFFVEAPEDFGDWLTNTLVPWLGSRNLPGDRLRVAGVCDGVQWRAGETWTTMTYQFFLADDTVVGDYDYDVTPPEPRPRYKDS